MAAEPITWGKKKNKNKTLHQTKLCFCLWGNWFCLQRSWWNWAELSIRYLACVLSAFVSCNASVSHKITVNKLVFLSVWFLSTAYSRACATICSLIYFFPVFLHAILCVGGVSICVPVPNVVSIEVICDRLHWGSLLRNMKMCCGCYFSRPWITAVLWK